MLESIQEIKQRFMAMRNGIVADTLRRAGQPYSVIFGLMVPQIAEIARDVAPEKREALADELWADTACREARLTATYLFDKQKTDIETSCRLLEQTITREEADMLAFRLLKHLPFAAEIVEKYSGDEDPQRAYAAEILKRHIEP